MKPGLIFSYLQILLQHGPFTCIFRSIPCQYQNDQEDTYQRPTGKYNLGLIVPITVWYLEYRMTVYCYTDTASGAVSVSNTAVHFLLLCSLLSPTSGSNAGTLYVPQSRLLNIVGPCTQCRLFMQASVTRRWNPEGWVHYTSFYVLLSPQISTGSNG